MAKKQKFLHHWECPHRKVFLLKPETILLAVFVFLVFIFSFATFDQRWLPAALSTLFFLLVFFLITHFFKKIYPLKEIYSLTHTGLTIKRKSRNKITKHFINYSAIKNFKLDKFFHGGRIETKEKRHLLFFNTKEEIEKLEKILKKKVKRK